MVTFNSYLPLWLTLSLLIPLSGFLLWQEWKRKYHFPVARMIAAFVMIIMIAGNLLRPSLAGERSSSILLLTPDYDRAQVDSLLNVDPGLITKHTTGAAPYKRSTLLSSYYDLVEGGSNIRFILGQGLPGYALDLVENKNFDFIPCDLPAGIIQVSPPKELFTNRKHKIEGTYNNKSGTRWIYLNGPRGKEDSVAINTTGQVPFSLSFSPRQSGHYLYSISIVDTNGVITNENIPLNIAEAASLNILFIQHYPTFEIQYLKNFLSQKNHNVVVRSQLSKNNFRYEYANRNPIQINRLTKNVLREFDVMIIAFEALENLTETERNNIREEIQSGFGVLALHNTSLSENAKLADFFPMNITNVKTDTAVFDTETSQVSLPALPMRVSRNSSVQSVVENKSGVLSGYTFDDAGKIGFQLLQETYRLALSGDSSAYSGLWTPLLEEIARTRPQASTIEISNPLPLYVDEPLYIKVISSQEKPLLFADSVQIPLREDVLLDDVWYATVWADKNGWHTLQTNTGGTLSFYISKKDEWRSLSIAEQMKINLRVMKKSEKVLVEKAREERKVSPFYFYLFFVLSAGFIWLAPKL